MGAEVTGVCSARNADLVRSLGADDVVDYEADDYLARGGPYDMVLQLAGTHSPGECRRALTRDGTLVAISGDSPGRWIGPVGRAVKATVLSPFVSQRLVVFVVKPNGADLRALSELIEGGQVSPVIDRTYPLADVSDAIRYVEEGHPRGKVVVTV
jgi:NADPH:quinone reductase-like Zn-dependent oxidoreductase